MCFSQKVYPLSGKVPLFIPLFLNNTQCPYKISGGFAIFNDFGISDLSSPSFGALVASTTFKPEATTLNFPSQQPQLSNGVTFANLLKRARLRTSEDNTFTTPLTYAEEGKNISKNTYVYLEKKFF